MKKLILAGAAAALLLGFHVIANPLMAASGLRTAIQEQDGAALAEKIDFDALRADLRQEVEVALEAEPNPMAREMARGLFSELVDSMLTEDTVTSWGQANAAMPVDLGFGQNNKVENLDYSFSFGLTNFGLTFETEKGPLKVVLAPRGLTWKVVGIDLDPAMLGLGARA